MRQQGVCLVKKEIAAALGKLKITYIGEVHFQESYTTNKSPFKDKRKELHEGRRTVIYI